MKTLLQELTTHALLNENAEFPLPVVGTNLPARLPGTNLIVALRIILDREGTYGRVVLIDGMDGEDRLVGDPGAVVLLLLHRLNGLRAILSQVRQLPLVDLPRQSIPIG